MVEPVGQLLAPTSLSELAANAREVAAAPPAIIAIHGGDGSLHQAVRALVRAFGDKPLPPMAILPGGTMNVIAASLGLGAPAELFLAELAEDQASGRAPELVARRCLRVGESYGFIFGNGLIANFLEEYYGPGDGYGPSRALWILARTFLSAMVFGKYARRIFRRFFGKIWVDEEPLPWRSLTGLAAATVREVGLGFKLNHRADEDPERFAVLAIHAGPLALARDLVAVHRGRGIAPCRAWSAVASRLAIEADAEELVYTIDGDLYRTRGRLEVGLGPRLQFVKPRGASGRRELAPAVLPPVSSR